MKMNWRIVVGVMFIVAGVVFSVRAQEGKPLKKIADKVEQSVEKAEKNVQKAVDQGVAKVDVKVEGLALHFVLGRSLVVHAKADDYSQPTGNAGPRVGVGVIAIAAEPKK